MGSRGLQPLGPVYKPTRAASLPCVIIIATLTVCPLLRGGMGAPLHTPPGELIAPFDSESLSRDHPITGASASDPIDAVTALPLSVASRRTSLQQPITAASAALSAASDPDNADHGTVLLWGPGVSSVAPRVALRGIAIASNPAVPTATTTTANPTLVWENLGEIPRAVEPVASPTDGANTVEGASFFADTEGSIMMLEPGVEVHTLVPRTPGLPVEHAVLSLAHHCRKSWGGCRLYFTVNTTIRYLPVAAGGRSATGPAVSAAAETAGCARVSNARPRACV